MDPQLVVALCSTNKDSSVVRVSFGLDRVLTLPQERLHPLARWPESELEPLLVIEVHHGVK